MAKSASRMIRAFFMIVVQGLMQPAKARAESANVHESCTVNQPWTRFTACHERIANEHLQILCSDERSVGEALHSALQPARVSTPQTVCSYHAQIDRDAPGPRVCLIRRI